MSKITGQQVAQFIRSKVSEDGKLTILGFGTFRRTEKAARLARNPQTDAAVHVPAKTVITFKASQPIK